MAQPPLRICSWNVQQGRRLDVVVEGLLSLCPLDLVMLQELSSVEDSERSDYPDIDEITAGLGGGWRGCQFTAQMLRGRPQANGLAWNTARLTLERTEVLNLPEPPPMLNRLRASRRNAVVADFVTAGGSSLRVHVVHLDVLGIRHKHAQLAAVLEDAAARPRADLELIAGDLNTYGVPRAVRWPRLRALAHENNFEELSHSIRYTHRAPGVRQKLDAILASPPGRGRAWIEHLEGSDHLPLVAEVTVAQPAIRPPTSSS